MQENILDALYIKNTEPPKAKLWKRISAWFIDVLITLMLAKGSTFISDNEHIQMFTPVILVFTYKFYMEYTFGATLGKMMFMIRIVTVDFKTLSIVQVFLRNILDITYTLVDILVFYQILDNKEIFLAYFPIEIFSFGFICIFFIDALVLLISRNHQALHDMVAKTIVIQKVFRK